MQVKYKKRSTRLRKYKSRLEAKVARRLGKKATYESEVVYYFLPKRYYPDFVLVKSVSNRILLEVKGYLRYEDQAKMKAVKDCNPELDIRFFFPHDNKVQGSKMKNSEWCLKYGFPFYIGVLPKDL